MMAKTYCQHLPPKTGQKQCPLPKKTSQKSPKQKTYNNLQKILDPNTANPLRSLRYAPSRPSRCVAAVPVAPTLRGPTHVASAGPGASTRWLGRETFLKRFLVFFFFFLRVIFLIIFLYKDFFPLFSCFGCLGDYFYFICLFSFLSLVRT